MEKPTKKQTERIASTARKWGMIVTGVDFSPVETRESEDGGWSARVVPIWDETTKCDAFGHTQVDLLADIRSTARSLLVQYLGIKKLVQMAEQKMNRNSKRPRSRNDRA